MKKEVISDIQIDPDDSSVATLFLGGRSFGEVPVDFASQFGLRKGLKIDEETVEKLLNAYRENTPQNRIREWIEYKQQQKPIGKQAMKRKLMRKGVEEEIISEVLSDLDDAQELDAAILVAKKQVRKYRKLDRETAKRRLFGFLLRREFNSNAVRHAVEIALNPTR